MDSLTKFARGSRQDDANAYSELEMHAELCYAEVLLLRAVLTLCEDENLVSFVKAGLKVRSCYQSFRFVVSLIRPRNRKKVFAQFYTINAAALFSTTYDTKHMRRVSNRI